MLLATCTAVCAQHVHASTRRKAGTFTGSSSSTAAAAAADADAAAVMQAHHRSLLSVLQLGGDIALPPKYSKTEVVGLTHSSANAVHQAMMLKIHSTDHGSTAVAAAAASLPLPLVEAWVLTLTELAFLVTPKHKGASLTATGAMLQTARALAVFDGYGPAGKAALDSCKCRLFGPLLQQLLQDAWQALNSSKAWREAGSSSSSGMIDIMAADDKRTLSIEAALHMVVMEVVGVGECVIT
jgi:hypothetical protein